MILREGQSRSGNSLLTVVVPIHTPADADIFVAGDFNAWHPSHPQYRLDHLMDHTYQIELPKEANGKEFKITRGDWDSVECRDDGNTLDNRVWNGREREFGLPIKVAGWCDLHPGTGVWRPKHTMSGDVRRVRDVYSPQLGNFRDLLIYLPPGYSKFPSRRYPVIYMQDGQNLFDEVTAYDDEWHVDEICEQLSEQEQIEQIVVAIPNTGPQRLHEYCPWPDAARGSQGHGERYARYLVHTVKPLVDATYRTLPGVRDTAVLGSSMGGLISLYIGISRPDVFGFTAGMSPSMNLAGGMIQKLAAMASMPGSRVYVDYGEKEFGGKRDFSLEMIGAVKIFATTLQQRGIEVRSVIDPEGKHNEASWGRRLPDILRWWKEMRN